MKKIISLVALLGIFLCTVNVYGASSQDDRGAEIYYRKCMACHQVTGTGIPGTFPPLKGSDFLKSASKKRLINQVMNGSNEHLTVNGVTYSTPMPPQVDNIQDAVAVINFILNSWGNNYGKATIEDAKEVKPVKQNNGMMMNGMEMMKKNNTR
ncbi:MAG: cytochrome c [Bacteroidales bacterium]|nr:cytochrome c [Bacteroidales bacterium]